MMNRRYNKANKCDCEWICLILTLLAINTGVSIRTLTVIRIDITLTDRSVSAWIR
jgi:hypothetical protein